MAQRLKDAVQRRALTVDDAAHYIGSAKSTLDKLRMKEGGPRFIYLSENRIAYLREDLDAWLDSQTKHLSVHQTEAA